MQRFLDRVTLTGVDEKVPANDVVQLSRKFDFAEFGVLMVKSGKNKSRRLEWLEEVADMAAEAVPRVSRRPLPSFG